MVSSERSFQSLMERFVRALNEHDLDSLVDCFHPEYVSEQPAHPNRSFRGREHVAQNWGWVFSQFDDFEAELLDVAAREQTLWTEWRWGGTDPSGTVVEVRGIMILEIRDGQFRAGRLYLERVSTS